MLQSLWNPFRDWNVTDEPDAAGSVSFKASETLLGIETITIQNSKFICLYSRFKASETLLGIETG